MHTIHQLISKLHCPHCDKDFETNWVFFDDVKCPHCGSEWETEWDYHTGVVIVRPAGEYKI